MKKRFNRRRFCSDIALTTAGMVVATEVLSERTYAKSQSVAYPPMRIEGASALRPGTALLFNYPRPNDAAILARTDDRSFYAYSQKCPHLGCSLHFSRVMNQLECPCHQGCFDVRSGLVVQGPPRRALDEIILQVRGGEVWAVGRRSEVDNPIV